MSVTGNWATSAAVPSSLPPSTTRTSKEPRWRSNAESAAPTMAASLSTGMTTEIISFRLGLFVSPHGGPGLRSTEGADRAASLLSHQARDLFHHLAQREDLLGHQHVLVG